ncbi:FG-GAP-like repeat-containing protein [Tichowtungia aerotolerans]|uniref:VCBS repeat-containing protein n=1 Tax=Tichowtungia aerotolerans TaxID=2697043 RepID=A0A6P1M2S5_9BACT|nr:FG-GAP-like repeat-containing protein [Tichowtungia aerotolerans]QHI68900.1 hypothetical protein GT409_05360 [Tichowtungia aerotolerans]
MHNRLSSVLFSLLLAAACGVAGAAELPVFPRSGNLADPVAGWTFSPEEAWKTVAGEAGNPAAAELSVKAGLQTGRRLSWYTAKQSLPEEIRGPGAFRFGGWIKIDDGTDYYRDHLAMIQLVSSGGYSAGLWSYCQTGEWVYFEDRVFVPAGAGELYVLLSARKRVYADALVSFKGVFLVPDEAPPPTWSAEEIVSADGGPWKCADRTFRVTGEVSDSAGGQPLWADFDFARLMLKAGCREPLDPSSIKVLALFPDGKVVAVPAAIDHPRGSLAGGYARNSTLKWRTLEGVKQYEIYFNAAGPDGAASLELDKPLGVGELLRYPPNEQCLLWGGWPGQALDVQDVDGDGDLDIYAKNTDAGIWLLRNIGTNEKPLFLQRQKPLQSDALPVMPMKDLRIDWDQDGAVDRVIVNRTKLGAGGYIDGVSVSLQLRPAGKAATDVVELNGKPVVFENATWFSMQSGDFDGDGLQDIAAGSADSDLQLLLNRGMVGGKPAVERVRIPWNRFDDPYDSGDMSLKPCPVDWNGDGRDDIVWTGWSGFMGLLLNRNLEGRAEFEDAGLFAGTGGLVNVVESPMPDAADWDGDGDFDLICGNVNGYFMWVENTGTSTQPKLAAAVPLKDENGREIRITAAEAGGTIQGPCEQWWGYTSCAVADVDSDKDLDLVINDSLGRLRWIENIGTRTEPVLSDDIRTFLYQGKPLIVPWRNSPAVADWDGDGTEEVAVLDDGGYLVAYPFNAAEPDHLNEYWFFKDADGRCVGVNIESITKPNSGRTQLQAADWDGDGDVDLMVGRPRNSNEGNLLYIENAGTPQEPVLVRGSMKARGARFAQWSSGDGHDQWHSTGPCMVDWNGDGKKDLIFGLEMGQLAFYTHDYFEGDAFPVFHADVFQTLDNSGSRTVFDFGADAGEFSESLKPLDYPPQLLQQDAVVSAEPRAVKIVSPKSGDVLSGPVVFEAAATGGRTITLVEFFVDGQFLAKERIAPFVAFGDDNTWDLQGMSDGLHELSVKVTYFDGKVISFSQTNRVENR